MGDGTEDYSFFTVNLLCCLRGCLRRSIVLRTVNKVVFHISFKK